MAQHRHGPRGYRAATMLTTRGEALIALGRYDEARATLNDAAAVLKDGELDPAKPYSLNVQLVLASADLAQGKIESARAAAQNVLSQLVGLARRGELWVTEESAHRQLAAAQLAAGEVAQACKSLDAAIALRAANALATDPRLLRARAQRARCS